jgi:hypothetical protein
VNAIFSRVLTGYDAATNVHTRSDTNVYLGDPLPHWTGSLMQTFEYGAFRAYGQVTWETGALFSNSDRPYRVRQRAGDEFVGLLEDDGSMSFASDSLLDFFTRLGSFDERDNIRLQEVSLAYQLPTSLVSSLGLGRTTATFSGQNLFWWDSCNCSDPNMAYRGGSANVISTSGFLAQPQPRTFTFSLRTTF